MTSAIGANTLSNEQLKALIAANYGSDFVNAIGLDTLFDLPQVSSEELDLGQAAYPQVVSPSALSTSAVRGMFEAQRPFVAIKLDVIDSQTKQKIATVVEVVFKRFSIEQDGKKGAPHENNFTTGQCVDEKKRWYSSFLSLSGGMSVNQMQILGQLLRGDTVLSSERPGHLLTKAAVTK